MAKIPNTIPVTGMIAPTDSLDTYATHDNAYGKGGFKAVATTSDRDAITADRRAANMVVFVDEDKTFYELGTDLTTWTPLDLGADVGNPIVNVTYDGTTGNLTFTKALPEGEGTDPATIVINIPVDNFLKSASYDPNTHILTLTLEDGTEVTVDLADLIDVYTFQNANGITFTTNNADGSTQVTAALDDGSIVEAKLSAELQTKINGAIQSTEKGVANGVAPLDENGKIGDQYLPTDLTTKITVSDLKVGKTPIEIGQTTYYESGSIPTTFNGNWSYVFSDPSKLTADSVKVVATHYAKTTPTRVELVTGGSLTGPTSVTLTSIPASSTKVELSIEVTDTDSNVLSFLVATLVAESVLFYGNDTKETLTDTEVAALTHVLGSSVNYTVTIGDTPGYKYIAIPADKFVNWTTLLDGSNGMPLVVTEQTTAEEPLSVTYNDVVTNYRVFRSTYQLNGGLTIKVNFPS